jgi:Zn-dependent peptidase ImmA (M78 family)
MTLRRGFKTEANWYARQFRLELGVPLHGPLCPWRLADHLCVPVYKLSEFAKRNPQAAYFLTSEGLWEFSGATFISGRRRLIVINDGHSPKRQASDLSHELSHCILGHAPSLPSSITGPRQYDRTQEEEANYLGPALLISEEAALTIARRAITKAEASDEYSVTEDVIQMRLNLTGAFKRVVPKAPFIRNPQTRRAS